ncbi:MAG: AMP-binding protein [Deltaproteobacteria bacterium]|nr:AMP-binding protein [Deltaproteobacteria bacterium]MBW1817080.1 AMP-binding protein [Deltaproteobacteria bacterium]MBW2284201.1 AMP-binding protein [Deltaproteobacteria bacterium]
MSDAYEARPLTDLIEEWAEKSPERTALRYKRFGIWQPLTWKDFHDKIVNFAKGLLLLGVKPGDHMSIIGDNSPEWLIAEFGAMRIGGLSVGIYQDMQSREITYLVTASDTTVMVVEDQEQMDKLISIWDQLKDHVVKVVVWDSRGMSHYFDRYPYLIHMDEVIKMGQESREAEKRLNEINITPDMICMMLPTSGTTGLPKLAMISHYNMSMASHLLLSVHPIYEWDEVYSLLPMPWMGEQFTVARFVHAGHGYNFPEGQDSVKIDFHEIQPTLATLSPRMYEDICSDIRARMEDAGPVKKWVYDNSMELGLEHADLVLDGKKGLTGFKKFLYKLALFTTLRGVRQRVGLGRIRMAVTGGAAIGREVFTFYIALGIDLMQLYGMTENCACATCHRKGDVRPETTGSPLPGVEIKVDDDGMIWVKSPTNIDGYYNNPEETADTFQGGWLKTGDSGYNDEYGHLVILDRQKDLMYLNDGTRFAPQDLANRLKFSPYIREAVTFGDRQDYITAMISIDMENVGNWANKRNIAYTTFTDLSQNDGIINLIREEIRKINDRLPETMRVHRMVLLPKELHPDDEELTRTRKVRRRIINERYRDVIEALYMPDKKNHDMDIQITYMDGRSSRLKATVKLEDI